MDIICVGCTKSFFVSFGGGGGEGDESQNLLNIL